MDMTLCYAKIANGTIADEYFAVADQVDARYGQPRSLPADVLGPQLARLRREHHRHLGNGHCTRPDELDCTFDSICQTCSYFTAAPAFLPVLQAQRDDAQTKGQTGRADLFNASSSRPKGATHHEWLDRSHRHDAEIRAG